MTLLFIGGSEIFIIGLIVVLLFGADKIPELARGLGKGMRHLKNASEDLKREINASGIEDDVVGDIKKEISSVKKEVSDISNPVKKRVKRTITDNLPDLDSVDNAVKEVENIKKSVEKVSGAVKRKK